MASSDASASPLKPGISPMPGKFSGQPQPNGAPSVGCPGGLVGCNPNTYTPGGGNHWHGNNRGYGGGLAIAVGGQQSDGDCYYVRRKIYTDVGVIMKRQEVCE